jgi:hypothetical protein
MKTDTLLPEGFLFSQSSLQDFVDCARRFELRYLLQVAWPAVPSEPALDSERFMEQGARFHRLAQQRWAGVPEALLEALAGGGDLGRWWANFSRFPAPAAQRLLPEAALSAGLGGYRLMAKYDLLAVGEAGRLTIYDWKTSQRQPRRAWLADRLQTRVYPFLLASAGASLNGGRPVEPEAIEMIYWFADFPEQPEHFPYSLSRFREDRAYLESLLEQIERLAEAPGSQAGQFPLTEQTGRCAYCVYRSLCDRGETAGALADQDQAAEDGSGDFFIDFDQVVEIAL